MVLDKPAGLTSAAAVDRVKRLVGVKRAGHAGTLDPMATGVLVICIGEATKIAGHLLADDKRYLATARLGEATDTWDADGVVVERAPVPDLAAEAVAATLAGLVGRLEQTPPAYAAIKQRGQPLYQRARRGEAVEAPVRTVEVHAAALLRWAPPDITFRVECAKGTYVRSLAVELAHRLGTLAHLTSLRRERSGPFELDRATPWRVVEDRDRDALVAALVAPAAALANLPAEAVDDAAVTALGRGQPVAGAGSPVPGPVRLIGPGGALVALGEWREGRIWPVRVLLG